MYKIFLVEDDHSLALAMKKQLENYDNEVTLVQDFRNVTAEFAQLQPQLVLMDIMLPFRDGYYWCREIRRISNVPILFISSASDNMNIVMAINMGADDFVAKPVDPMVLNAKVSAILRRTYEIGETAPIMEFHGAILNISDRVLHYEEQSVELTRNEFLVLKALLENKGKIVAREQLMMKLWQDDCYVEENTLTVNVARLRKKIEEVGLSGIILTKPGSGYILE